MSSLAQKKGENIESVNYFKKDMIRFLIILAVFVGILVGLKVWDSNTAGLTDVTNSVIGWIGIEL